MTPEYSKPLDPGTYRIIRGQAVAGLLDDRPRRERVSRHVPHQGQREIERRRMQALRAERKAYARFVDEERERVLIEWEADNG